MIPADNIAEGQERNALADRRRRLRLITLVCQDFIYSEGSTTSSYFDLWCRLHDGAEILFELVDEDLGQELAPLIDGWISSALDQLLRLGQHIPWEDSP